MPVVLSCGMHGGGEREIWRERGRGRGDQAQTVVAGGGGADLIWAMRGVCEQEEGVIKSSYREIPNGYLQEDRREGPDRDDLHLLGHHHERHHHRHHQHPNFHEGVYLYPIQFMSKNKPYVAKHTPYNSFQTTSTSAPPASTPPRRCVPANDINTGTISIRVYLYPIEFNDSFQESAYLRGHHSE